MERNNGKMLAGVILLGFVILGISNLFAQRFPGNRSAMGPGGIGRFQVVQASGGTIILLDTVTGDLYRAGERDVKPYKDRPRVVIPRAPGPRDDVFPRDGRRDDRRRDAGRPRDDFRPRDGERDRPRGAARPRDGERDRPRDAARPRERERDEGRDRNVRERDERPRERDIPPKDDEPRRREREEPKKDG